jgi:NhaP-type Na+/H+ or K+/H+ antiporter
MEPFGGIVSVIVLGAVAQWVAWRLRVPSILVLLLIGFLAGPVTGVLHPDELFGALLLPLVSLSVGLILFEGGLSLRIEDLRLVGRIVRNLLTIGAATTCVAAALAAYVLADLELPLALLLGALLVVTGPTVILPLLRHVRPTGHVGRILRWEGIANDPIGALFAVLVFEFIVAGQSNVAQHFAVGVLGTIAFGGGAGVVAGGLLAKAMQRHWIPDYLLNALTMAAVVMVLALCNAVQQESGLFAVTIMGIALANQPWADVRPIVEFKENLRVFLISALFILLSARLSLRDLAAAATPQNGLYVLSLIVVARPLSVWVSCLGSDLPPKQRLFLAWMAPRGIVAAAVASIFSLELERAGHPQANQLALLTFATIIGTVLVYGLSAAPLAHRLGLAERDPQGVLIVGAHEWSRRLAQTLQGLGVRVLLLDTNYQNVAAARMMGLPAHAGSALAENVADKLDLTGLGRLLAVTSNEELNVLACQQFHRVFGRAHVFQLPPAGALRNSGSHDRHLHGTWLFSRSATFREIDEYFERGGTVKATKLTAGFDYSALQSRYGPTCMPLFIVDRNGRLHIAAAGPERAPQVGDTVIVLAPKAADSAGPEQRG